MWKRVAVIVVGSALLGSALATLAFGLFVGAAWNESEIRAGIALCVGSLIFTLPGAAALVLIYAKLETTIGVELLRYLLVIVVGGAIGAVLLSVAGLVGGMSLGGGYGASTATAWVLLHALTEQRSGKGNTAGRQP